ncbi:MAG: GNAT family N-acetyltransferase [Acidobacteriota bacterium]|nr:GNAT family N-acetyltransferase [Acidobacteriota bacterium]
MSIQLRQATPADAAQIAPIIKNAFDGIADKHKFPCDFPTLEHAANIANWCCSDPTIWGVVAEENGKIIGSNFLHEGNEIAGVGPITVDPNVQASGVGRKLMEAVIERGLRAPGVRLIQDAFNTVSMPLYAALGFDIKEPLVFIAGEIAGEPESEYEVRQMNESDFDECDSLHRQIHGFSRLHDIRQNSQIFQSFVALRENRIVAYASAPNFWQANHAVAETEADLHAVLLGAARISGQPLSFLLPTRQASLFRWCLNKKMRVVKPMSLMAMGAYNEPRGAFLTSVLY